MTVARRLEKTLNLFVTFSRQHTNKQYPLNSHSSENSKMWAAIFVLSNITGDMKNFVEISLLLNKTKIVEI